MKTFTSNPCCSLSSSHTRGPLPASQQPCGHHLLLLAERTLVLRGIKNGSKPPSQAQREDANPGLCQLTARQRSKQPKAGGRSPSTEGWAWVLSLAPPPDSGSPSPTWGAILVPGQAAYLGHHFDQCFHVLEDGSLELRREEQRRNNPPLPHVRVSGLNAGPPEGAGGSTEACG